MNLKQKVSTKMIALPPSSKILQTTFQVGAGHVMNPRSYLLISWLVFGWDLNRRTSTGPHTKLYKHCRPPAEAYNQASIAAFYSFRDFLFIGSGSAPLPQ